VYVFWTYGGVVLWVLFWIFNLCIFLDFCIFNFFRVLHLFSYCFFLYVFFFFFFLFSIFFFLLFIFGSIKNTFIPGRLGVKKGSFCIC
jgi:hypothetical protein